MNVPLLNFFDNVSQSLQNPEFVSFWAKRRFSQKNIYAAFSNLFPSVLLSFKSNIWNVFFPAIFLNGVNSTKNGHIDSKKQNCTNNVLVSAVIILVIQILYFEANKKTSNKKQQL
jgi:hypothetical protein